MQFIKGIVLKLKMLSPVDHELAKRVGQGKRVIREKYHPKLNLIAVSLRVPTIVLVSHPIGQKGRRHQGGKEVFWGAQED